MASNGKWEVVGKGGKKRAPNEGKKNKVKSSDMPKADIINPLGESKTIYQALKAPKGAAGDIHNGHVKHTSDIPDELPAVLAERVPEQAPEMKKANAGLIGGKKKTAAAKPQKTDEELLQEALSKVDLDELTAMLTNLESSFPNNPSIWLTDIGAHLQLKLKGVPQKDPVFEGKPADYPMCLVPSHLKTFFLNLLKKCPEPTLKLIYQRSIENMVQELSKGSSAYGDQIIIQFIVQRHPQITLENLKEVQEMLVARKTRTREALTLMWCAGQLPDKNLAQGLRVWMELMMPQLCVKQLTKYSISYLENLLSTCKPSSVQEALIEPKEFFAVMELAFSPSSPLASNPSLQRKILSLYPQIKRLSLGAGSRSLSRMYFPTLLGCLSDELSLEYKTEVLSCLVMCLQKDAECFTKWENSYTATLPQSGLLLNHFVNTWDSLSTLDAKTDAELKKITALSLSLSLGTIGGERVNVIETSNVCVLNYALEYVATIILNEALKNKVFNIVEVFQAKNRSLLENSKTKAGLNSSVKACQAIQERTAKKSSFFSVGKLFKLILFLLVAAVAIDIYKHKGYKASKTAQIAKDYGIEKAALTSYEHVTVTLNTANSWVQTNYPTYYNKFRKVTDPAAAFIWEKLTIAGTFIAESTKPARDYLNVKIPELLEKIETEGPVYLGIVRDYLKDFWDTWWPVVHKYLVIVWDFLSENVPVLLAKTQELLTNIAYKIYELAPDFFSSVASWFAKLGEKIAEKLPDVLAVIQEYAIIAVNLAVNLINSAVGWVQNMVGSAEVEDAVHQKPSMAGSSKTVPQ